MKTIEQIVIDRVCSIMKEKNITQTELARKAGLLHQSVYKIVHSKRFPTLHVLEKIALALEVDLADLVTRKEHISNKLTQDDIYHLFQLALKAQNKEAVFEGLTQATALQLVEVVKKFGGWDFLYEFLIEELEIRKEAEKDYQRLRDSLSNNLSAKDVSIAKNKMIVSKMIAKLR